MPTTASSQLQAEIKQTRPFSSAAQEAVLGVWRTADLLQRRMTELLAPFGISPQQYNVLRILRGAGERGVPTLEIGARMIERSPGVTRLVDRLVAHGWADRTRCQDDRRVVYCRLTPAGRALLERADVPLEASDAMLMQALTAAEQHTLIGLLDRVRASLEVGGAEDAPYDAEGDGVSSLPHSAQLPS